MSLALPRGGVGDYLPMEGDYIAFESQVGGTRATVLVADATYLPDRVLIRGCMVSPKSPATCVAFVAPDAPFVPLDGITLAAA